LVQARLGPCLALATLSGLTGWAGDARATSCPAPEGAPALAAVSAEARLRFLSDAFDREIRDIDLWSWSWGTTYVAAGGAQAIATAFVSDHGARIDLSVGAVSAAIGALSLYGLPLEITLPLRASRRTFGDPDLCRVLSGAEGTLVEATAAQRLSSGWVPHAGNVAFNAALALVLGFGFKRWESAALSAGIGTVVGEANVLTEPHHLSGVLERYRAGRLDGESATAARRMVLAPMAVSSDGRGMSVTVSVPF
jgi:hypothetical protein